MRKNKLVSLMVLGVVTFSMTACGDKLTKLSPENEKAVVSYASAVVSKYNKNQDKGFIRYEEEKKSNEDKTRLNRKTIQTTILLITVVVMDQELIQALQIMNRPFL